ncbi:hypothetical protein N9H45_09480, partial [Opitutales bacterium]|nr:hypothetical protein [Opitutales bacterium]
SDKNTPTQILASGVARLSQQPVPFAETFTVSGGQSTAPFYDFNDSQGNIPNMTSFTFHKGSRYLFTSNNISGSHPFMIGTSRGVSSPIVNGGPLNSAGNGHQIIVDIPQDFNSTLVYYCTNHSGMTQNMSIASPGNGFVPVYNLSSSQLTPLVNSQNILAGNYSVVEEMNSSNQLELRIRPVVQTNGSWVHFGANQFYRTNSSYPTLSSVQNYLTTNNITAVNSPSGGYQTPSSGYQTPSGGNQSPGGGYQTPSGGYQTPSGGNQSPGGGYQTPSGGYSSPGNGYSSPGGGYSSAGSGYSSPPIYETTATLIVNNQPTSITGIPRAATGSTWYQSFTAENSAKLTKFAFATNGSFSATADVTIREGEGVAGNILHSGTWTGLGSNTNSFNEYEITNEVLLTSGQKYTIQLENQTAGGFIGSNPGQYNGGMFYYSGYSGEYGDLKMKIWGQLEATGNAIDIISPATNDQNITDDNHTLTISYNYQSDSGGYQTPTWAYRIDSGFPSYGSPHGGTQVTGSRTKNNFLSGQTYGSKTVYVALLDQSGNLHNPPITLIRTLNYQSSGSGYSSPGGGYSTPGSGYSSPGGGYSSPSSGHSSPGSGYSSPGGTYQQSKAYVSTRSSQSNQTGFILSGEFHQVSNSETYNLTVGFLISQKIDFNTSDSSTQKIIAQFETNNLFTANYSHSSFQTLYFRAFAENESGTSYGNIQKIEIKQTNSVENQTPAEKALSALAAESTELNGGWNQSTWFGLYKSYENGWIYHINHGWLFLSADSHDGIWTWSQNRGWTWSKEAIYPFIYQSNIGNWIYYLTNRNGQPIYFNYSNSSLEGIDP